MTITRQRARQIPRPVPKGTIAVRHDVLATWRTETATGRIKIATGVAMEEEARLIYAAAVRHVEETEDETAVILERVTVETLELHEPGGLEITLTDAQGTRVHKPARPLDLVAAIARAFRVPLGFIRKDLDAGESFRATHGPRWRIPADNRTPEERERARFVPMLAEADALAARHREGMLIQIAAHHQGGNGRQNADLAEALGVPFPITMPDLAIRALESGFVPRLLWPWWEAAPETLKAAREHKREREAPEIID